MSGQPKQFAVVTGASSGIGLELAKCCAKKGFDLVIASDGPSIKDAAAELERFGGSVVAIEVDLSTLQGVERLYAVCMGRKIDVLIANAGCGLGRAFLEQDITDIRRVVDTNIVGTVYLVQTVGREMRARNQGKILITGSIAGEMPGPFMAVYSGTKAFINSFAFALRNELQDTNVTVTCLMPGATETNFFAHADMLDTEYGKQEKDSPARVAKDGFKAMTKGESHVVSGVKNKLQVKMAAVMPATALAEQNRKLAEPEDEKK
jgi:short-subunit dehydrogenase